MIFNIFALVLALPFLARAAPNPLSPSGADVFKVGDQITVTWGADTTGLWTSMNIQFMSGPNSPMVHMRTLTTIDATKETSFTFTAPSVTPTSKIYFLQFTSSADPKTGALWVTRFTIAGADGSVSDPVNTDAQGVQWGVGTFTDPSQYNAPPTYLAGNGQVIGGSAAVSNTTVSTGGPSLSGPSVTAPGGASVTNTVSSIIGSATVSNSASETGSSRIATSTSASVSKTGSASASASSATSSTNAAMSVVSMSGSTSWVVLACAAAFGAVVSF